MLSTHELYVLAESPNNRENARKMTRQKMPGRVRRPNEKRNDNDGKLSIEHLAILGEN